MENTFVVQIEELFGWWMVRYQEPGGGWAPFLSARKNPIKFRHIEGAINWVNDNKPGYAIELIHTYFKGELKPY